MYIYFNIIYRIYFFPIPTDVFLVPYVLAKKKEYLKIAIYVTVFSVLGGIFAYYIGFFIWNKISPFLTEIFPIFIFKLNHFNEQFYEVGIILIIIGGFSPFPIQNYLFRFWNNRNKYIPVYNFLFIVKILEIFWFHILFLNMEMQLKILSENILIL